MGPPPAIALSPKLSDHLKSVVDAVPMAWFVKDRESRIVLMNLACEEQWGMSFDALSGTNGSQFFPADQMQQFLARDRAVLDGGVEVRCEEVFWNAKRQQNRIGHTIKRPILAADGRAMYLVGITVDITDARQAESSQREADQKLRALYLMSPLGIALNRLDGSFVEVNAAFERIVGYTSDELLSMRRSALTPPEYAEDDARLQAQLDAEGRFGPREKEYLHKNGSRVPVRLTGLRIFGADGEDYVWSVVEDATAERRAVEQMKLAALIYQRSTEAIIVTDHENRILEVNPAFTSITGYAAEEVRGENPRILKSGLQDAAFYRQLWSALHADGRWQGELWNRHKSGRMIAMWYTISAIRDDQGRIHRFIAQFSDITAQKSQEEQIWKQANFDPLTNLPNRRLFRDRLEQEVRRAEGAGREIALLFVDLDHFKDVNDALGHDKGDYMLMEAAVRISGCIREHDTVAHLGGDEFAVMLSGFADSDGLERSADAIVRALARPYDLGSSRAQCTASVGIALYPRDTTDIDNLLKHVDQAMYRAKERGRNQFAYFQPSMQQRMDEKFQLTNALRDALDHGQLVVHYQPIVDLASGKILKAEALVRWQHPTRGLLGPGVFIPLAEESSLISEIGEYVFQDAMAQLESWRRRCGRLIQVTLNVAPGQFVDANAMMHWPEGLQSRGLPGHSLTIEILEGLLERRRPEVQSRLLALRNAGIEVAIDDFGTGYSNFGSLKQSHVDYLKIDRSLVTDLACDSSDRAIVQAIIVMAKALGFRTIAEGVETEAQRTLLLEFGCDMAQGFLFHRPMEAQRLGTLLGAAH
jgi:diguanylate cyclase (GGDEF)-like protein/PAS domain S-box-containing protein